MLYESELKILELIWNNEGITAKEIARILGESTGWSRSTTYTIISRCIEKGYIRREAGYRCYSVVTKGEAQRDRIRETLSGLFDNSVTRFFTAFTESRKLTAEERDELKKLIDDLK